MYNVDVFRSENYKTYLTEVKAADNLKQVHYWEQKLKTMWQQIYVSAKDWRCYACWLPVFHKPCKHANG